MSDLNGQTKRLVGLAILFAIFVYAGVVSLQVYGGGPGSVYYDAYKILQLFVLSGDWAFQQDVNTFVKMQAYVAPVFTIVGIVELFTAQLFLHVWQTLRLSRISGHAVLAGLNDETLFLLASFNQVKKRTGVVIIDPNPPNALAAKCRRGGAILIKGDPGSRSVLARARIHRSRIAISFLQEATDSLQFVLSANAEIRGKARIGSASRKSDRDLWVRLKEAGFGVRLGEYFKFAGMSESARPRFFSIEEIAARRVIRAHPPEIYADAQGQSALHLCIYGHNALSTQVIVETLRQSTSASENRVNITLFTAQPDDCRHEIRALIPEIGKMANLDVRLLTIHPNGISSNDYSRLPEQSTLHVVCYEQPEVSVNVALSLRRLLLTRPDAGEGGVRRVNAPILVHLANTRGIGELLRSNVDRRVHDQHSGHSLEVENEIPDGIFAFGAVEDILTGDQDDFFVPTLIDSMREEIAKHLHFSYVGDRSGSRGTAAAEASVTLRAEREWERLPQEFRESSRQAADHIWAKATAMRFRITEKKSADARLNLTDDEHELLAKMEHHRWLNERFLSGWAYGKKRVDAARRHDLLRPWSALSDNEKTFDKGLASRLQETVACVGLEIKREFVIGVVGHRPGSNRDLDQEHIRKSLREEIGRQIAANPDRAPVILTALAEGTDTIAAEIALELNIPYWVPLPMPYDAYSQDYERSRSATSRGEGPAEKLRRLVALSERYIELPLKFGDLTDVSLTYGDGTYPAARERQYALAGAYIAERADVLIAVWDGNESLGTGGTGDIVSWRRQGRVPGEFASPSVFRRRPVMSPPVIISPTHSAGTS